MATRNFYLIADIDGRKTPLTGGPQSKDGGFSLTVMMRDGGRRIKALEINGVATFDGELTLDIHAPGNNNAILNDGMNIYTTKR